MKLALQQDGEAPFAASTHSGFTQDLQTLAPDVGPRLHTDPGNVSSRPRDTGHNAKRNRVGHDGNDWDCVCRSFET
jgi:hypothetical protein